MQTGRIGTSYGTRRRPALPVARKEFAPNSAERDQAALEERSGVRAKIKALLDIYNRRTGEPPFTLAQLITMAVLSRHKLSLTMEAIFKWIIRSVKFYRDKALDGFIEGLMLN